MGNRIRWLCSISLFTLLSFSGNHVRAAGFDCAKASTEVEKAICASSELSALDDELSEVYAIALRTAPVARDLRSEQRLWLARRDNCLKQVPTCMSAVEVYKERIDRLRQPLFPAECGELNAAERGACFGAKSVAAEKEMRALIQLMNERLFEPGPELAAQAAWLRYRNAECKSRIIQTGPDGGAEYQSCILEFTTLRIADLRSYHFCDHAGCPAQK